METGAELEGAEAYGSSSAEAANFGSQQSGREESLSLTGRRDTQRVQWINRDGLSLPDACLVDDDCQVVSLRR